MVLLDRKTSPPRCIPPSYPAFPGWEIHYYSGQDITVTEYKEIIVQPVFIIALIADLLGDYIVQSILSQVICFLFQIL